MLQEVFELAGFRVVSAFTFDIRDGKVDLAEFLDRHQPGVVIYDIAPPYKVNWDLFTRLQKTVLQDQPVVLTTTNTEHVERLAGSDERIYEVVDKAAELDEIMRAAKEALRSRRTR